MKAKWRTSLWIVVALLVLPTVFALSIQINSPTHPINYYERGNTITLNFTIEGGSLSDCSWEYNGYNTTVFCSSGGNYSMAIGDVLNDDIATDKQFGEKIQTNAQVWVDGFNKSTGDASTHGYLQTTAGVNLSTCTFGGTDYCDFPGFVQLTADTTYYVLTNGNGANVNHKRNNGGAAYPVVTDWINYTISVNHFVEDAANFNGIMAINVSNIEPTATNLSQEIQINASDYDNRTVIVYARESGVPSTNTTSWNYTVWAEEITYNLSMFDLQTATYTMNVTYDTAIYDSITAILDFNKSTSYAATRSGSSTNVLFTNNFVVIPADVSADQNIYWNFTLTNTTTTLNVSSTRKTVEINASNFSICGGSPQNVPFINFTFFDEETSAALSARADSSTWVWWFDDSGITKSYTYSSSTVEFLSYAFCGYPPHVTFNLDLEFKYGNDTYPQRTYKVNGTALTNSTTNQVLYLLSTDDGIYTTIQVIEATGSPISGVTVTAERYIGGVWLIVGAGVTDDAGSVTFWVNPNYNHRITASRTGYLTQVVTIQPTQSVYTLTLTQSSGNATYVSDLRGILWEVYPSSGEIEPGLTNFNVTITSTDYNLEGCLFQLVNVTNTSQVFASGSDATNSTYCYINFDYIVAEDRNMFGILSIDTTTTDGYVIVDADFKWIVTDRVVDDWRTVSSFFTQLRDLSEFGEGNRALFSRLVFFFLISTIFIGVFTYFTGVEIQSQGVTLLFIFFLSFFASLGGFLTVDLGATNVVSEVFEQFALCAIMAMYSLAFYLAVLRRANE